MEKKNYENIVQRFEYYLQELDNDNNGIVICDQRERKEDEALRAVYSNMLYGSKGKTFTNYKHLIEHILLVPLQS